VPDSTNHTWIDTTFIASTSGDKDTNVQLKLVSDDIIGAYSMPIIYRQEETTPAEIDIMVRYYQEFNTISGVKNIATGYRVFEPPKMDGVFISLTEYNTGNTAVSGVLNKPVVYTTGYNAISGTLDNRIIFTGGREMFSFVTVRSNSQYAPPKYIAKDYWVNYVDFSGNLTTSGTPIPFYYSDYSFITEYGEEFSGYHQGWRNNIVDVSFAGWVDFPVYGDVYSTIMGYNLGYRTEITSISGSVDVHYMDVISVDLGINNIDFDIYCAVVNNDYLNTEAETINGGIGYIETDIYSTIEREKYLTMDIDLLSLKISNFSLGIGEYTTASGFISIDITDDECPVSTSGTYFMVDDLRVPVIFSDIEDGYRMFYNPNDDYISLEGSTVFTVHAENECNKVLEQDFYLTFGYIVEYTNRQELFDNIDYGFQQKIVVRVTAENYASCPQVSSLAWDFESKPQANVDLGASIVGKFHAWEYNEMLAKIYPHSTAYFYGKEFRVVVKAKDFAGNQMEPLILNYRIEDKPI
jgi:hypothetical protein